ncbi:MAG: hypothetical protein ACYC9X_02645, partial [Dehalococcoidia bacterium]
DAGLAMLAAAGLTSPEKVQAALAASRASSPHGGGCGARREDGRWGDPGSGERLRGRQRRRVATCAARHLYAARGWLLARWGLVAVTHVDTRTARALLKPSIQLRARGSKIHMPNWILEMSREHRSSTRAG